MYVLVTWMKCTGCKRSNVLFYAKNETRKNRKPGVKVGGKCKLCWLEDKRCNEMSYYSDNKDKLREKAALWRNNNPEKVKLIHKNFRNKNKLKIKEQKRLARFNKEINNKNNLFAGEYL